MVSNEPMSGVLVRPVGAVSGTSAVMALFRSATPLTHGPWEAEQLWVARREQAPGAGVAKTRLAVKVAAWSTITVSSYCMCLLKSVPLQQIGSSGTHKSMVLAAYSGPTAICGSRIA